jgi:phenylalanyl-tRNA synthetase beta chain
MQSQKVTSEAGVRMSRGVHASVAKTGVLRCIEMMRQIAGGTIAKGMLDVYPLPDPTIEIDLPLSEVDRLLGFNIPRDEIVRSLRALEFQVTDQGQSLHVIVPDTRLDIGAGLVGQADLIEEIARIYGYDRIPNTVVADALPPQRANITLEREEAARDALVNEGLREVVTYRLTTPEREAQLTPAGQPSYWPDEPYVTLANPISADKAVMRHTLLAGLLEIAAANARHTDRLRLFEVGNIYLPVPGEILPDEPAHLGILLMGARDVPGWYDQDDGGLMDFFDLKGVVEGMLRYLRVVGTVTFEPTEHSTFHPGRVAVLKIDGRVVGVLGEIHPVVRETYGFGMDLKRPILGAEFDLHAMLTDIVALREINPVPTQPAVYQDIALIVDQKTPAADVLGVILDAGGDLLQDARLFDVYQGDPIPTGKKSLAYNLTYRASDRTLNDQEVAKAHEKIAKAAQKRLGASLRTE